jgi:hypothetical protein
MTTLSEADEKLLQEQARIEALKGPIGRGSYVRLPPTAEELAWQEAQAKRQEAAKRPTPARPPAEIDFLEQRRQQLTMERRQERLKAATGGRLE